MKVAEAFVELRVDSRAAEGDVRKKAQSLGGTFASIFGAAAFGAGLNKAIQSGSRLEQSVGAIDAVFGKSAKNIEAWAKGSAKSMGLSEAAAREALALIGAQLKNFGYSIDEAQTKGQELVELGADLAATFGGTTTDAVSALTAALRGEIDPIERYGVSLNQARVQAKALELGLISNKSEMDGHAKAVATLAIITEQTTDAQGQFARELDTVAGKQAVAAAEAENASASLGQALAPAYERIVEIVTQAVEIFGALPAPVQLAVVAMAGLVLLSGPLGAFKDVVIATKAAMTGIGLGAAGLGAGVAALGGVLYAATKIYGFYADEKKRAEKATQDFAAALQAEASGQDDAVESLIATRLGGDAVTAAVKKMGISWKQVTDYIVGKTSPEFDFLNKQFSDGKGGIDEYARTMIYLRDTFGLTDAEASALLVSVNEARRGFESAASAAENQAIITDALGESMAETADKTRDVTFGTDRWTSSLTTLYDAIRDNADEADRLHQILDDIFQPYLDIEESTRAVAESLDDLTASIKENGTTLDINTEKGRANREAIQEGAEAIFDHAAALQNQGATAKDTQWAMLAMTEQLREQAIAAGLSEEEFDAYIATLGLTPENISTVVHLQEIDQRKQELEDLLTQLEDVDDKEAIADIRTKIERGELDEAESDIRALAREHDIPLRVRVTGPKNIVVVPTSNGYTIQRFARGGYIDDDQLAYVHRNEVVLPLSNPQRMRTLLSDQRVYAPLAAAIGGGDTSSSSGGTSTAVMSAPAASGDTYVLIGADERVWREIETRLDARKRGRR